MTDTPKQPATEAGRALRRKLEPSWLGRSQIGDDILAIEAEAAAGLLALREAGLRFTADFEKWRTLEADETVLDSIDDLNAALADTAPAAADEATE